MHIFQLLKCANNFCVLWAPICKSCNYLSDIRHFDTPNREHTQLMTVLVVSCGYVRLCQDIHMSEIFRRCLITVWRYCESVCVMFLVLVLILYYPLTDLIPVTECGPTWCRIIDLTFRSWRAWKSWEYLLCTDGSVRTRIGVKRQMCNISVIQQDTQYLMINFIHNIQ